MDPLGPMQVPSPAFNQTVLTSSPDRHEAAFQSLGLIGVYKGLGVQGLGSVRSDMARARKPGTASRL